ncbi:N-acetylmuramic acid 6-phosphate etherase [Candidatus Bathyarchaeota archaeon]|nr:N-acetylmuramic acid 6-phosphate etherase [Candidatus Bathyarchaeota archaeon]
MKQVLNKRKTEQRNPLSEGIDLRSIPEILEIINREDSKITDAISLELDRIGEAVRRVIDTLRIGGNVYFIGSGTSGRMGVLEAAEIPPTYGIPPKRFQAIIAGGREAVFRSIEAAEDSEEGGEKALKEAGIVKDDLIFGVSASGSTPFVIGAIKYAADNGNQTIGLSCNPDTPLSKQVTVPIEVITGPEVVAGSTRMKAGTAQKMVLNMITTTALIKMGLVYDGYMVGVQAWNEKLVERSIQIIRKLACVSEEEAKRLLEKGEWDVRAALILSLTELETCEAKSKLEKNYTIREILADSKQGKGLSGK